LNKKIKLISALFKRDPENNSVIRVFFDLIKWLVLNQGKLYYFYVFGLYKKGSKMDDYIYHPQFVKIRKQLDTAYFYPLLEDKFIFDTFLKGLNFPTPEVVGMIENYELFLHGSNSKKPLDEILKHEMDVYCKLVYSWGGKNVFRLQVENGTLKMNGEITSVEQFKKQVTGGKYILQDTIEQHDELNRMNPWCANTLRVITLTNGREPSVLAAILRIGINQNFVDNASGGNLQSGVGMDNKLNFKGSQWGYPPRFYSHHPDSGIPIVGFEVPYMDEVRDLCINLHRNLNYFFVISWDIAITNTGPVVIEGNPVPDIMPMQMQSKGFKSVIMKYADEFRDYKVTFDTGAQ